MVAIPGSRPDDRPGRSRVPTRKDVTRLVAEDLVAVLDFVSRVCTAADGGNLHYLQDKAGELVLAAQRLQQHLPARQLDRLLVDPARLRRLVTRDGRHYRAGRALYPQGGSQEHAGRTDALRQAAAVIALPAVGGVSDELGLTREQADAVAAWLLTRAGASS